jgi:hypothetical protein
VWWVFDKYIFYMEYINVVLPKDYHLVKAHVAGGEICKLWWSLELCWRECKLLTGSPKPDRSKSRSQIKCSSLVLQVGVGRVATTPCRKKFLVTKPHIKECRGYVRRSRFFKNCRGREEEKQEEYINVGSSWGSEDGKWMAWMIKRNLYRPNQCHPSNIHIID